jgi:hypothetical protein
LNTYSIRLSPRHLLARAAAALGGAALLTLAAFAIGMPPPPAAATPSILPGELPAAEAQQALRYDRAVQALRAQDYAGAYGRFADLADEGHAASAQWALVLVSQGPTVFGSEWSATRGQLRRWTALSAREARDRADLIPEHDRGE